MASISARVNRSAAERVSSAKAAAASLRNRESGIASAGAILALTRPTTLPPSSRMAATPETHMPSPSTRISVESGARPASTSSSWSSAKAICAGAASVSGSPSESTTVRQRCSSMAASVTRAPHLRVRRQHAAQHGADARVGGGSVAVCTGRAAVAVAGLVGDR